MVVTHVDLLLVPAASNYSNMMVSWSTFFAGFVAGIASLVGVFLHSVPLEIGRPIHSIDDFEYNKAIPLPIWKIVMSVLPRFQHAPKIIMPPKLACMEDLSSYFLSGVLCNLAELNVASVLSSRSHKEGMPLEELAEEIGVKRIDILRRLIQLVSLRGYFYMESNLVFNTPMSTYLHTNNNTNADFLCFQRHLIYHIDGNPAMSDSSYGQNTEGGGSNLITFMKREQDEVSPTGLSMQGKEFWSLLDHYDKRAAFDNFMTFLKTSFPTHFDFPFGANCDVVVDLGGGNGHTLYKIMEAYPGIKNAVLFDLESQVFNAKEYWNSQANGMLINKVEFVGGDFFDASTYPTRTEGKRTCYVLGQILHDWNDASALKILSNVASQMQGKDLLLVEEMLPNDKLDLTDIPRLAFDYVMMLQYDGEERSFASMKALLEKAGLNVKKLHQTRSPFRWAEVVKA